ncbi:hypothetical protein KEJ45_04420 [Candidatus Bathyarchaeota archaeon]|nr:hypothetical protein [Candidatus Bathyarchaeota archaeon]
MLAAYSKRQEKLYTILKELAFNEKLYQKEIVKKIDESYRHLIRQLQFLQKKGLIKLAGTEPSSKRGKDKNIWELTFLGLLTVLQQPLTEKEIDVIASKMKDKWLIFQEWESLTKDSKIKEIIIHKIRTFSVSHQGLANIKKDKHLSWFDNKPEFKKFAEQTLMFEATKTALCLDDAVEIGNLPSWFYEEKKEMEIMKLWRTAASIPSIRKFLEETFKVEKVKYQGLMKFKKWLQI